MKTFFLVLALFLAMPVQAIELEELTFSEAKLILDMVLHERPVSEEDKMHVYYIFGLIDASHVAASSEYGFEENAQKVEKCFFEMSGYSRKDRFEKMFEMADPKVKKAPIQYVLPIMTAAGFRVCAVGLGIRVES